MKRILFILCILFSQLAHAEYFKRIGMSNGLSQLSVMSIYQDELGRMWFGTREGVSVYDGHSIISFKAYAESHIPGKENVKIDNDINCIQGDKNGHIFLQAGSSLIKYNIRKEAFETLKTENVNALSSYKGEIWSVIGQKLYFYNHHNDSLELVKSTQIKDPKWLTVTENKFYIGTKKGLYAIGRKDNHTECLIPDVEVYRTFESSQKELWVGCRMEGLYRIDANGKISKVPYSPGSPNGISSKQIRDFCEDKYHNIWFGTFDGLQKYSYRTGTYSLIKPDKSTGGLNHPSIFAVYKDQQGLIWLGSYYGAVNYFNPGQEVFQRSNYDQSADKNLYFSYIGEMTEDRDHNLWICTDGGGVSYMHPGTHTFTNFKAGPGNTLPHNNVKSICYDKKRHQIYIGTYLGGLSRYDIAKNSFYNYQQQAGKGKIPGNIIFHTVFKNDRLYLSSNAGFFEMNPETNEFKRLHDNTYCQSFDIDNDGYAWLIVWGRLICINLKNPKDQSSFNLNDHGCPFRPTKVKATAWGIYFGTLGSGIYYYSPKTKRFVNYTAKKGQLLSDYCYNLAVTKLGNILITSDKGISLFSPNSQTFRSMELPWDFPAPAIINDCGVFVTENNQIYVGDVQGLTAFHENDLRMHNGKLELYFSKLSVNNRPIYPGDETEILPEALPFLKELNLKHNQNNLTINFSISNYSDIQQSSRYEYKLEGFDKQWITSKQMSLHYTNLDPGKYTLHIRTLSNGFNTEIEEIVLPIYISSPWYNSFWSWLIYLSAAVFCITYFIRSRTARRVLALSLEKEQFEKRQIEQLNHAKLLFFTNVSHEFRTPLTLIISHIDQLLQKAGIPPTIYNPILKIHKNAQQMKNLVSELLDFRKFEQNYVILKVCDQNLVTFLKEIYYSFLDYAHQRNITFIFTVQEEEIICCFDAQQMEKVFFNLLSNAFKYTPDAGNIEIILEVAEHCIYIKVKDSGAGIEASEAVHIFDRFYQANNKQTDMKMNVGTGIGLALTRSIVEKHHGNIHVESEKGKGSTFVVCLQKGKQHFTTDKEALLLEQAEEKSILPNSLPIGMEIEDKLPEENKEINTVNESAECILIVEDNKELLTILEQLFAPYYRTLVAHNGKEGLELAISEKPNLIVSDVMMPEMTGTEMCISIKNDIDLCHIPVILLTALNTNEQNIEGLNSGADDYITKPFNAKILLARCNNLIRNRLLLQRQMNEKPISEIDLAGFSPLDKDLLKRAVEIIDNNIDDPEFDIPQLCKEIGMGRTLLYSKFKALTGMTPNNFILNHKLKHASILLVKYPEVQIAEISDRLGFGSAVYFTRCFKNQFNETPQAFRKKNE